MDSLNDTAYQLNAGAYQIPEKSSNTPTILSPLPEDWMEKLLHSIKEHHHSELHFDLLARMEEHVGNDATYPLKLDMIEHLKMIYSVMSDVETPKEAKEAIALKLIERVEHCMAGFHDGVNMIVRGFERPDSLVSILHRIRESIVAKVANQSTDEVHTYNRFFTLASHYGVRALNAEDSYVGEIDNTTIYSKLALAFKQDYQLFGILNKIEEEISSELLSLGYLKSTTPDAVVLEKSIDFLSDIFKDTPAVVAQRKAQEQVNELKAAYDEKLSEFMVPKRQAILALIGNNKAHLVDQLIKNTLPERLTSRLLNDLTQENKQRVAEIQKAYAHDLDSIKPMMEQINNIRPQLISPFLLQNDDETKNANLNWSMINQSIRTEMLDKKYVTLTQDKRNILNALFDANQTVSHEACAALSLNDVDVMHALEIDDVSPTKKSALIHWYIHKEHSIPEDAIVTLKRLQKTIQNNPVLFSSADVIEDVIERLIQPIRERELAALNQKSLYPYESIPDVLFNDKLFMLQVIRKNAAILRLASYELKNDKEFMLLAVWQSGWALGSASSELKNDKDIVLVAVGQEGFALQYASAELQNDKDVVLAAVRKNGLALQYASAELQNDKKIVLVAVGEDGFALGAASAELQNDKEVVLAAVGQDGWALLYASAELRNDKEVVRAAVGQSGSALKYASDTLRQDRHFIFELVTKYGLSERFIPDALRDDIQAMLARRSTDVGISVTENNEEVHAIEENTPFPEYSFDDVSDLSQLNNEQDDRLTQLSDYFKMPKEDITLQRMIDAYSTNDQLNDDTKSGIHDWVKLKLYSLLKISHSSEHDLNGLEEIYRAQSNFYFYDEQQDIEKALNFFSSITKHEKQESFQQLEDTYRFTRTLDTSTKLEVINNYISILFPQLVKMLGLSVKTPGEVIAQCKARDDLSEDVKLGVKHLEQAIKEKSQAYKMQHNTIAPKNNIEDREVYSPIHHKPKI